MRWAALAGIACVLCGAVLADSAAQNPKGPGLVLRVESATPGQESEVEGVLA
jgi:hypothetical protein